MEIQIFKQSATIKRYLLLGMLAILSASVSAQGLLGNDSSGLGAGIGNALSGFFSESGTTEVSEAQVAAVDTSLLEYRYDPSVTPLSKAAVFEAMDVAPDMRAQVSRMLDSYTLAQQQTFLDYVFSDHPAQTWQANNMGDVLAFTTLIFFALADELDDTTLQQDNGVRDFISVALSQRSEVVAASNQEKQVATESILMMTMLLLQMLEQASSMGMTEVVSFMQQGSVDILMSFGLHPDIFTLGATGIEPTAAFIQARPQIEAGTLSFEAAFPQVAADYRRLGIDDPVFSPASASPNNANQNPSATLGTHGGNTNPLNPNPVSSNPLNPLSPAAPRYPLVGSFSDGTLSVSLETEDGYFYTGTMLFNGQSFKVEADSIADGQGLMGQFYASGGGDSFSFDATLQGSSLHFESDGNRFVLQAQ